MHCIDGTGSAMLPSNVEITNVLQWSAPESIQGAKISTAVDMYTLGMLIKSFLHSDQAPKWTEARGLARKERVALLKNFNNSVYDDCTCLPYNHPLLDLIERLLQDDAALRPRLSARNGKVELRSLHCGLFGFSFYCGNPWPSRSCFRKVHMACPG